MDNIYYLTLLKCFNNFSNDIVNLNDNYIRLFINILRTCIQITIDNKYMNSTINEFNKYHEILVNDTKKTKYENIKNYATDYIIRILQLIVSSNSNLNQIKLNLQEIRKILFKHYIEENYKLDFWENFNTLTNDIKLNELKKIEESCIYEYNSWINLEIDLICICEFINKLYKLNNFNQFTKFIDKYNGCIPIDTNTFINCNIIKSTYLNLENEKKFNIKNYINKFDFSIYLMN
jgi:hypothetical protein